MGLRTARERLIQTLAYEASGILIAAPAYDALFGAGLAASLGLMGALSAVLIVWVSLHNTVFDHLEWRLARRCASDRPHRWRLVHAISHEASSIVVTTPVIMWIGGHGLWEALVLDLGLTVFLTFYAYLFHLAFDRLRPVRQPHARPPGPGRPRVRGAARGYGMERFVVQHCPDGIAEDIQGSGADASGSQGAR